MKPDEYPECYVEANDNHWICYVIEYRAEEFLDYEELEHEIDGIIFLEVIQTCRICGQQDVYYPAQIIE